jgi:hypothetical protein
MQIPLWVFIISVIIFLIIIIYENLLYREIYNAYVDISLYVEIYKSAHGEITTNDIKTFIENQEKHTICEDKENIKNE